MVRRRLNAMFRITSHIDDEWVLRVEGCLAAACVPELERCWREAEATRGSRALRLDLTDVCHVDGAGQDLLMRMCRAGVGFTARGCAMRELVREVAESSGAFGRE
jgi:anti-anti-sigma regulatory factor